MVKDVLATALTAATNANATLSSSDLATAITTAQAVYNDEDATQEEVNSAAAALNAATELAMSAAGDVTGIFLTNPGFETCTVTTTNAAAGVSAAPLNIGGNWTQASSAAWSSSAVVAYGGSGQVNGVSAPSADNEGNSGNALGVSVGWGGTVTYQSDAVTLPAGVYTLKINAYNNLSGKTQFKSKFGFVPTTGNATLSTKVAFAYATWETDRVTLTLNEATEGKIQVGGQAASGGSGENAKVFFDNITITYSSFLAGAKEAWDEAVAAANQAKTDCPNVTGEELTALNAELAKAEPTTVEGYNTATEALTTATTALRAAATSYNNLVTVNGLITAAGTLKYADADKKPSADVTATSASDADTKAANQYAALRAYYESHALAEGVNGAVNYNEAIADANADKKQGWTGTIGTNTNEGYTGSDGVKSGLYLDGGWSSNAAANIDIKRTVEVPAGKYLLTVKARGSVALTEYTLSIAGKTIDLPHANGSSNGVFGNGWEDASIEFESDGKAQTLEVIAKSETYQQWMSMNDFRLVQLELNKAAYAGEKEYTALNTAITTAENQIDTAGALGFEKGEYAPYNVAPLKAALAKAKAIDQEAENLKADVDAITSALTAATEACVANADDVDAIYNGNFATVTEGANYPNGWTRNNGWGQMQSGITGDYATAYYNQPGSLTYGSTGDYTMPLAANQIYKLTFAYRSHENNSNNGMTVSLLKAGEDGPTVTFPGNGSTSVWSNVSAYFATDAEGGEYVLTLANGGNTWITNVSLVKADALEFADDNVPAYAPGTYPAVKITRTLKEGNWATAVYPFAVSGVDKIAVLNSYDKTTGSLSFKTAEASEANVPFLMRSTTDKSEISLSNVEVAAAVATDAAADEASLKGVYATTEITNAEKNYVLSSNTIYAVGDAGATINPYRAYIQIEQDAEEETPARLNFFVDGQQTTGIEGIAAQKAEQGTLYNLQGQRIQNAKKGLYIQNGKKVVRK